eukprot:7313228-Alexandrium_andersonii.AAC.1
MSDPAKPFRPCNGLAVWVPDREGRQANIPQQHNGCAMQVRADRHEGMGHSHITEAISVQGRVGGDLSCPCPPSEPAHIAADNS